MRNPEETPVSESATAGSPATGIPVPRVGRYLHPDDPRAALVAEIDAQVRRLTVESQKLGHAFADRHGLHPTDFEALVHVMDAEGRGTPLTPSELATALNLSTGATTSVIDRLERQGHVRRDRAATDRRKIHLRYAEPGAAVAAEFFGGLRTPRDTVMAGFSDAELQTIRRFLTEMSRILTEHRHTVTNR